MVMNWDDRTSVAQGKYCVVKLVRKATAYFSKRNSFLLTGIAKNWWQNQMIVSTS